MFSTINKPENLQRQSAPQQQAQIESVIDNLKKLLKENVQIINLNKTIHSFFLIIKHILTVLVVIEGFVESPTVIFTSYEKWLDL